VYEIKNYFFKENKVFEVNLHASNSNGIPIAVIPSYKFRIKIRVL